MRNIYRTSIRLAALFAAAFIAALAFNSCMREQSQAAGKGSAGTEAVNAAQEGSSKEMVRAPEFPENVTWLNINGTPMMGDLRGKVVLLDFWTFCCINCIHVLPELRQLEEKYPDELVVIGVHSAKFDDERNSENIKQAILRYGVRHPVVNDYDMDIWDSYAVRAWPTTVLVSPTGYIVHQQSGENIFETYDKLIADLIKEFDARGEIDRKPYIAELESAQQPASLLSFPGKLAVNEADNTLVISDSGNNRIVVAGLDGAVREVIGSGEPGFSDGDFRTASFLRPQGVYYDAASQVIYVADTDNHSVRRIDLASKTVSTLAGNGKKARGRSSGGHAPSISLASPWDLCLAEGKLYVAMAGFHQIWSIDPQTLEAQPWAGSGREDIVDASLAEAQLAQPSGIIREGAKLFFADSETSSIRSAELAPSGSVATLVGEGLFEFGDKDGAAAEARLQHPLGLTIHEGQLYIADTYNNKVKRLDLAESTVSTLSGSGSLGRRDGTAADAQFSQPNDVEFAQGKLYVADTNNHMIRLVDPASGAVSTLMLSGLQQRTAQMPKEMRKVRIVNVGSQQIAAGKGSIVLDIALPRGTRFNEELPLQIRASSSNSAAVSVEGYEGAASAQITLPVEAVAGSAEINLSLTSFFCDAGNAGLCYFDESGLKLTVEVTEGAAHELKVQHSVMQN